ncbi:MAG TPA: OmpH family outer membrane protein [Candidatus Avibacteroides faecavium]|nr:OmpH family outer membrane protein [Candidatus Avibacteroides faecavium]
MTNNLLTKGLLAAIAAASLTACAGDNKGGAARAPKAVADSTGLTIVYVRQDSLLSQYNLYKELSEANIKKEENVRATLNAKQRELEKDAQDFQYKLENNAYATRERAEQEQSNLIKKQQELQALNDKLVGELANEAQQNMIRLTDSVQNVLTFIREREGYDIILADPLSAGEEYDITAMVLEELNKRYPAKD